MEIIPSKVYYILSSVEEYSSSSQVLHAMNTMPECQICSLVVLLPEKGKQTLLCNIYQRVSCTFLHVTA